MKAQLRQRLEGHLIKEDVSWDYQQTTGNVANVIVAQAALADVIVVGHDYHRDTHVVAPIQPYWRSASSLAHAIDHTSD